MSIIPDLQKTYKLAFLLVIALLGYIAFFDYQYGIQHCILSYIERTIFLVLGIFFWTGALYSHTLLSKKFFAWLGLTLNLLGIATVIRHIWVQHLAVAPEFSPLDKYQPVIAALKESVLGIPPGCNQIYRIISEVRLTELILAAFVLFTIICLCQLFRK